MQFPLIIYKEDNSDYCGYLPDFPNMLLAEKTPAELAASIQDAVEVWMDGEEPAIFPDPTPLEAALALPQAQGRAVMLVDVDPSFLDNQTTRISLSLPAWQLARIDRRAKELGLTRSALMARGALAYRT